MVFPPVFTCSSFLIPEEAPLLRGYFRRLAADVDVPVRRMCVGLLEFREW